MRLSDPSGLMDRIYFCLYVRTIPLSRCMYICYRYTPQERLIFPSPSSTHSDLVHVSEGTNLYH